MPSPTDVGFPGSMPQVTTKKPSALAAVSMKWTIEAGPE